MSTETQKIDIHDRKKRYETQLANFKERKDINQKNKELILDFLNDCISQGLSVSRTAKYLTHLTVMDLFFKKQFKKAMEKDIRAFLAHIETQNYSAWTVRDFKTTLKKFFRWLYGSKEDPALVSWFNTNLRNNKHKLPEEMLTEEEVKKLIEAANHPRDKAFIAALWESGARVGELGKKLELIVEDDQCTAQAGISAMNKLVNIDEVVAVSGPDCGSAAGSFIPLAQEAGTPVVIRWASVPGLPKIGNYIFRVYPSDAFQGKYAAEYIFNELGKRRVAVLYVKNDYGQGLRDVLWTNSQSLVAK